MGVYTYTQEIKCKVPAKRMFKAFVTEMHEVLPKVIPHVFKSVEHVHGHDGHLTFSQTNFAEGFKFTHAKYKYDLIDEEHFEVKMTLIEGGGIGHHHESLVYHQKYEDTPEGCVIKITREWHTKGEEKISEEVIKAEQESYEQVGKSVEEYLIAHPEVCA